MSRDISNSDDTIDSRDVIGRIAELEDMIESEEISEANGAEPTTDDNGNPVVEMATCGECGMSWNDALVTGRTPAPSGRCPYEHLHDEIRELKALKALADEAEGYAADWTYGETLIRDSYFPEYARELADDIGAIDRNARWPLSHIDWDAAADELKQDYTSVDFDGVTYWIR